MSWLNPYRWLLLLGLVGAVVLGYFSWERHIRVDEKTRVDAVWQAQVDKMKLAAAKALADEVAKTATLELKWSEFKNQQEIKDGKAQQVVAGYKNRIARLLGSNGGRLRDPNAEAGCGSGGSSPKTETPPGSGNSGEHTSETGGLLSEALSGLLAELTSEADQINIAYASCRADALNLRLDSTLKEGHL